LGLNKYPEILFGQQYKQKVAQFDRDHSVDFLAFANSEIHSNAFYKSKYSSPNRISSITEFKARLGFIDKNIVLENFTKICSTDLSNADQCTTGGTSGKPLVLFLPKDRFIYEFSALHALWSKIGYQFSTRAVVRNERLEGSDFLINPITKEVIFDGFRTDDAYLLFIYKTMKKYRISFYHGYTSNAERFARFLLGQNLDYSFLKGIITSSENLYAHQIDLFDKLKGVQHLNFYGHSEKLILGGWCTAGKCYHFYNSYGYAELIDSTGNDVTEVNEIGELVGSTNYNRYMPLFRYKTGDFARKAPDICPGCGFTGLSAYEILGRWNGEKIYANNGDFVTTTALNLHSDIYKHISGLQYYQPKKGILEVRVVPSPSYSDSIELALKEQIQRFCGQSTSITVRRVSDVERHRNGKYRLLISDITA
jgi:phenylacetate-CoA ligase